MHICEICEYLVVLRLLLRRQIRIFKDKHFKVTINET